MSIKAHINHQGCIFFADLDAGIDITIVLDPGLGLPKCFYAPDLKIEPVIADDFIGDIASGGFINFKNVMINPHGNGTHTECVGHIISGNYFVSDALTNLHWIARLITINPALLENGDMSITYQSLLDGLGDQNEKIDALIIRTLPNDESKCTRDYSGTNPPYIDPEAMGFIAKMGVQHLLVDLPSVDREEDGAKFASHKAFWTDGIGHYDRKKTITELVYIDNVVKDGLYLCSIVPLRILTDASPSRIMIFPMQKQ